MSIDWDNLAGQYQELVKAPVSSGSNESIRTLVGYAASKLPRDNPESLSWFISALQGRDKWFVAKVMAMASPVPGALLDPLLLAALLERNPSANRYFVEPCVRTFGASRVEARIRDLSDAPGVAENRGVQNVMYWVPRVGA
ncbi:hypothetical protein GCM10027430_27050 [Lysobacter tyrosinilyticus]